MKFEVVTILMDIISLCSIYLQTKDEEQNIVWLLLQ